MIENSSIRDSYANRDLDFTNKQGAEFSGAESLVDQPPRRDITIKKRVVRHAKEDGFFRTGVEVVEHEEIDVEATAAQAAEMLRLGQLDSKQIREILEKKLKDDRIFGYSSFEEFNEKYFKKELVAFEEFHKIRQLKYARMKYNNRMTN